ncbi:MAG: D-alanyl-D-alanine carboxypeptidase/D-alanyl-D-alanine-endopeptidase [Bacteroidota bacterium]
MKFRLFVIISLLLMVLAAGSNARERKLRRVVFENVKELQKKIDDILNAKELASSLTGIKIISVDDGKILYEKNSAKLLHPASNTKLITTAAALAKLPRYKFQTKLYCDGKAKNGVINGNLYLKGGSDPLLVSSDLDSLADIAQKHGIVSITGNLVGDISFFDTVAWGRGWMWDDEPSTDEPFITPLSLDSNCVSVSVAPSSADGMKAIIHLEPDIDIFTIANSCLTQHDTVNNPVRVTRRRGTDNILIQGAIFPGAPGQTFTFSAWQPELVTLQVFRKKLQARGITIKGECVLDTVHGKTLLGEIDHPIDSALVKVNKESYNLGAENLLKTLASEIYHAPGTWENGILVVKDYLFQIGVDTSNMILMDGSGVSFYNLFTPSDMVRLLRAQYRSKTNFGRFYATLPVAGIDGTLRNRMKGTRAEGNVHAKTGTLTGASALSGYVTTVDNKLLAFSIMSNHFPGEGKVLRDAQNKILELLADYKAGK